MNLSMANGKGKMGIRLPFVAESKAARSRSNLIQRPQPRATRRMLPIVLPLTGAGQVSPCFHSKAGKCFGDL